MFKIDGGDFPKNTGFAAGKLVWGIKADKQLLIDGWIEDIEILPSAKSKEVSFICKLKDGRQFMATSDPKTFKSIQLSKMSSSNQDVAIVEAEEKAEQTYTKPKKKKKVLPIIMAIFIVGMAIASMGGNSTDGTSTVQSTNKYIKEITKEQEQRIISALAEIEAGDIRTITHDEILDETNEPGEKGYRVSTPKSDNIILYLHQDGEIHVIRWADKTMYKFGEVKDKLTNYLMTTQEASSYKLQVQTAVESLLKAPSTAKFPNINEWGFDKNPERVIVQGYVDAQNGFGAMIRSEFQVTYGPDGQVKSFIFEGTEYMK